MNHKFSKYFIAIYYSKEIYINLKGQAPAQKIFSITSYLEKCPFDALVVIV